MRGASSKVGSHSFDTTVNFYLENPWGSRGFRGVWKGLGGSRKGRTPFRTIIEIKENAELDCRFKNKILL